jgi:hypothetical protein
MRTHARFRPAYDDFLLADGAPLIILGFALCKFFRVEIKGVAAPVPVLITIGNSQ